MTAAVLLNIDHKVDSSNGTALFFATTVFPVAVLHSRAESKPAPDARARRLCYSFHL
jgi:hypothetical protein